MEPKSTDPFVNIIQDGILRDIEVAWSNECWRAVAILLFAGMDAMATLDMPEGQTEVKADDFISWADRYVIFNGPHQVRGIDLYASRCATLHTTARSPSSRGAAPRASFCLGCTALEKSTRRPTIPKRCWSRWMG